MLIKEIRLQNLLSFGPDTPPLELRPLNVLIGPNGSGKSNLIEAISLLQAAPTDITEPAARGGGASEWIWKGAPAGASAEIVTRCESTNDPEVDISHRIRLQPGQGLTVVEESLAEIDSDGNSANSIYSSDQLTGTIRVNGGYKQIIFGPHELNRSILSLRRDPEFYPGITELSYEFERIKIYRDWYLGRHSPARVPQNAMESGELLSEDASNFALAVATLLHEPKIKQSLLEHLELLGDTVSDIGVANLHGTVQLYLHEGSFRIPASRLSDGTLRFICLLAILCHSSPPPLICIEEPELGLHPDMIPTIAELLQDAATRTQLIVTTHSDVLVDALTDTPEDVVVCEKHEGCTTMRRLDKSDLAIWLEKYSLGNLWISGQIGGNRF